MSKRSVDLGTEQVRLEEFALTGPSEATLLHRFISVLEQATKAAGLSPEIYVDTYEKAFRGRPDARCGLLLVEAKRADAPLDAAIRQIQTRFCKVGAPNRVRGIAYNGLELAFVMPDGSVLCRGRAAALADLLETWLVNLSVKPSEPLDIVNLIGASSGISKMALRVLWRTFTQTRSQVGFVDEAFQIWKGLYACAVNVNDEVRKDLRRSAASLGLEVTSNNDVEVYLFCVQTYFTTLLRLLLAKGALFCGILPGESLRDTLGESPVEGLAALNKRSPGVLRLFEPDAFLWFQDAHAYGSSRELRQELTSVIAGMVDCVDFLDLNVAGTDFLRTTYQRFFDPSIRRALGEFYTPEHIITQTLNQCDYSGERGKRLIDFSCGSGGFLLAAIRRKMNRYSGTDAAQLLDDIVSCIEGMDIHPLAVAMAKVNYLLAIAPLVKRIARPQRLFIPVYWGDALMRVRRGQTVHGLVSLHVPGMGTIQLPSSSILDWEYLFETLAAAIQTTSTLDENLVYTNLWNRYSDEGRELELHRAEEHVRKLVEQIVSRHRQQRDMRWLPLLRNAIVLEMKAWQPGEVRSGFDYVVGNPPWVRIHSLSRELKEQLRRFDYRFFTRGKWRWGASLSGGEGFANQVDYSVVFLERALDLLRPTGQLSLVVTSKVAHALYAGALRSDLMRIHRIKALSDYSLHAEMLFEGAINYPLILTVEKDVGPETIGRHDGNLARIEVHWPDGTSDSYQRAQRELAFIPYGGPHTAGAPWALVPDGVRRMLEKMNLNSTGQPQYLGEVPGLGVNMGVKTSANGVFLIRDCASSTTPGELVVQTDGVGSASSEDQKAKYRVRAPVSMLRPALRGRHIRAWHVPGLTTAHQQELQYMLWTHDDTCQPMDESAMTPDVRRYFEHHTTLLTRRSDYRDSDPPWTIYRVDPGKLGPKVVWSEMARSMRACFVPERITTPLLDRPTQVVPIQTAYLIPVCDASAGYFIAGILNSTIARAFFCSFAERAYSAYFRHISWVVALLPVGHLAPVLTRGTAGIADCPSLVRASAGRIIHVSQSLHATGGQDQDLLGQLDALVCDLFGLDTRTDLVHAKNYLHRIAGQALDEQTDDADAGYDVTPVTVFDDRRGLRS